ncbi:hypothetical protein ACHAXT_008638 [Thalassiosira profunda]
MTSRKRAKGRARRATANVTSATEIEECQHGFTYQQTEGISEPIMAFTRLISPALEPDCVNFYQTALTGTIDAFRLLPDLWQDDFQRETMKKLLIEYSVNGLLRREHTHEAPGGMALIIYMLEQYQPATGCVKDIYTISNHDIFRGDERSVVKFYARRINCDCLLERYQKAKSVRQTGVCSNCDKRVERKRLMYCPVCEQHQYCSKACHKADWSRHRDLCVQSRDLDLRAAALSNVP